MKNTSNKLVLIIDDSPDIQGLLTLLLESKGYSIHCTSNGEDAISFLNSSERLPDIILLDLRMPVMDGSTFLELKSQTPRLKDIPTVVMSGDDAEGTTRFDSNDSDFLIKPLNMSSIVSVIERRSNGLMMA